MTTQETPRNSYLSFAQLIAELQAHAHNTHWQVR